MNKSFFWLAVFLMIVSALFLPFFVTVAIFLLASIFLDNFYIGIFIFFLMDAIYGFKTFHFGPFYGILSVSSILVYLMIFIFKDATFFGKR